MSETKKKRSNVWAFVIYPDDSAPKDYINIIQSWHIPCLVSPIHDKDINADYTEKKKHIHIMMYFGKGANKSYEQVKEYSDQLSGSFPIIVNNTNAMVRYFIHYDNPEKHQYKKSDLISLCGFDIGDAFESYSLDSQFYDVLEEIIMENGIFNYYVLVAYLRNNNFQHELDFLRRHTNHIRAMLDGKYHQIQNNKKRVK